MSKKMKNTLSEKNNHEDIFNLDNIEDLPPELKNAIGKGRSPVGNMVLELFDIKDELSSDEIMTALWRKFKIMKNRNWTSAILSHLVKKGKLAKKSLINGTYKRI